VNHFYKKWKLTIFFWENHGKLAHLQNLAPKNIYDLHITLLGPQPYITFTIYITSLGFENGYVTTLVIILYMKLHKEMGLNREGSVSCTSLGIKVMKVILRVGRIPIFFEIPPQQPRYPFLQ
jgi:hypothetical protein